MLKLTLLLLLLVGGCVTRDCTKCELELEICRADNDAEMVLEDHDGCFKQKDFDNGKQSR